MLDLLLLTHSIFRYFVLIFLIVLVLRSLLGMVNKSAYQPLDEKFSLWLFIVTHTQLLIGLILYFVSPVVVFSGASMKDPIARYWLIEHNTMMIIAIVFITLARITAKKLTDPTAKYRRLFIFNAIALLLIVGAIVMSGRNFFGIHTY